MDSVMIPEGFRVYSAIFLTTGKHHRKLQYCQRHNYSDREGEWVVPQGTAESQKGDIMAPGGVHAGYKNSLYVYAAEKNPTSEDSFEEWLVELTTGLELALEGNTEDADDFPKEHKEAYSSRKKDWEEVLEQATEAEVMLRQALENGLGQQEEEEKNRQKQSEEESDNDFSLEGAVMPAEGTNRNRTETTEFAGNSQSLRTDTGNHAEYLNLANGEKNKGEKVPLRVFCLTCETQCERKNKGR